jgi:hypothetical protein
VNCKIPQTVAFCLFIVAPSVCWADMVTVVPTMSNTIYADNTSNSNALGGTTPTVGLRMDTGAVANGAVRRALLEFNVAGAVPSGAMITSASLQLTVSISGPGAANVQLHTLQSGWGQGSSGSNLGQGAPATPGDATWKYNFFNTSTWVNPGGDFSSTVSGSVAVGTTVNASYTVSSPQMAADVQNWLNSPSTNFGWILLNNESTPGSVRGFYTEDWTGNASFLPELTIDYTPAAVPEPSSLQLCGLCAAVGIVVTLARRPSRNRLNSASSLNC